MVGNRVYGLYPCACNKKGISEKLLSSFQVDHWMIDSGVTNHLISFKGDFFHLQDSKTMATVANGQCIDMFGPGTVVLRPAESSRTLTLLGVWYTPKAKHWLLSVPALAHRGYKCTIDKTMSRIWDNKGQLVIWMSALSPSNNLHWFQFYDYSSARCLFPCNRKPKSIMAPLLGSPISKCSSPAP